MKKMFLYIIAYSSILVALYLLVIIILDLFKIVDIGDSSILALITMPFAYFYHKYKPMEFKELLKKIKQKILK